MATVERIELVPLVHPLSRPYGMARGLAPARQATLVRVRTSDGVIGIGESWGPWRGLEAALAAIGELFVGRSIHAFDHVFSTVLTQGYHFGVQNPVVALMGGIDVALRDAVGRTLGVSVSELLGGRAVERVHFYGSGGYLTEDPERDLAAQLESAASAGYRAYKLKIGRGPEDDRARVRAARETLGPGVTILVDANGNYPVDLARRSMARIADLDVGWYEEPLPPQDLAGYAELRRDGTIPVAAGEALYTAWDFKRLIDRRAVDVVQPDITLCGGLGQARTIATLAMLDNLRFSPHVWGGAVGLAAALHLVAALPAYPANRIVPGPPLVELDVGENPLRDSLLATPITHDGATLAVPDGPGLGIALDEAAVERHRADR